MIDRRREPRVRLSLPVVVSGTNVDGERFVSRGMATSLSRSGALLTGLAVELRCGDMLTVEYAGQKADFRIVWVLARGRRCGAEVAVHKPKQQACPWEAVLSGRVAMAGVANENSKRQ